MIYLITLAERAATEFLQADAVEAVAESQAASVAGGMSMVSLPIVIGLLMVTALAVTGAWLLMTRKAYPARRYRRITGQGPFERIRDALIDRLSLFVP